MYKLQCTKHTPTGRRVKIKKDLNEGFGVHRAALYLIKGSHAGETWYKIGRAVDPASRFSNIQVGCPFDLELLSIIPCKRRNAPNLERELHGILDMYRIRGEWFQGSTTIPALFEKFKENNPF